MNTYKLMITYKLVLMNIYKLVSMNIYIYIYILLQ